MKLCILGGGGFRTPYVYQALLREPGTVGVDRVVLYDLDPGRLEGMRGVLAKLAEGRAGAPRLQATTSLSEAVSGADFVFCALRVGGLQGRVHDERVALELGMLGQETTGPGGIAYALRTVPVALELARTIHRFAPRAHVINFTNPAGIITEAMQSVLGDRVVGICDTPSNLGRRIAGLLGVEEARVELDYVGLNHLGWLRRLVHDGTDLLPGFLADDDLMRDCEEAHVFGTDWLRTLGCVPNEYLYYYYFTRDAVASIARSPLSRGEFLARQQTHFYDELSSAAGEDPVALWRSTVAERSASYMAEAKGGADAAGGSGTTGEYEVDPADQGYAGEALALMRAITDNERSRMIVNVRNGTTIAGLPEDAVIEVPAAIDANGAHPLATAAPDLHQLGLMQQVKAVERHAIAAARDGSKREATLAFALHPLVDSFAVGRRLLEGYIDRIPEVAAVFEKS